ncbi:MULTISPECIES: LacI family DNA-binding transcriptional regulator [Oceanobacillus]|uniref:LacI family DNA-binding transcriptional regulator n=1 Tax=Oceanobacillus aidingensis TaxID=645964 RepID=A0ABV9JSR9_9BACI|nr:LacI family DNA-binding transcriptional regulator [Oceanobacillus oncorhynchi]UUI39889.1 LacI family transcriptional regulator [Oceanobacillus oncorhynchi]
MATIREIAEKAGVSSGTVSFILNGKADKMRISASTQKRVLEVAREMGYLPSISARRLRNEGEKNIPIITLLWTLDARASLVSRFLQGIQNLSLYRDGLFELLIQPYENGKLHEVDSLYTGTRFNGAIITNASNEDMDFLENNKLKVPLVVYLRETKKYSSVTVDGKLTGNMVASYLADKGHKEVGIVIPNISSQAIELRQEGFLNGITEYNLKNTHTLSGDFSEDGGYKTMRALIKQSGELPTALFFLSDPMAIGALSACNEFGLRVPEDIEIIGHDNNEQAPYTYPSLTTVHLPVEEMAIACVHQLMDTINHQIESPVSLQFKTEIIERRSC